MMGYGNISLLLHYYKKYICLFTQFEIPSILQKYQIFYQLQRADQIELQIQLLEEQYSQLQHTALIKDIDVCSLKRKMNYSFREYILSVQNENQKDKDISIMLVNVLNKLLFHLNLDTLPYRFTTIALFFLSFASEGISFALLRHIYKNYLPEYVIQFVHDPLRHSLTQNQTLRVNQFLDYLSPQYQNNQIELTQSFSFISSLGIELLSSLFIGMFTVQFAYEALNQMIYHLSVTRKIFIKFSCNSFYFSKFGILSKQGRILIIFKFLIVFNIFFNIQNDQFIIVLQIYIHPSFKIIINGFILDDKQKFWKLEEILLMLMKSEKNIIMGNLSSSPIQWNEILMQLCITSVLGDLEKKNVAQFVQQNILRNEGGQFEMIFSLTNSNRELAIFKNSIQVIIEKQDMVKKYSRNQQETDWNDQNRMRSMQHKENELMCMEIQKVKEEMRQIEGMQFELNSKDEEILILKSQLQKEKEVRHCIENIKLFDEKKNSESLESVWNELEEITKRGHEKEIERIKNEEYLVNNHKQIQEDTLRRQNVIFKEMKDAINQFHLEKNSLKKEINNNCLLLAEKDMLIKTLRKENMLAQQQKQESYKLLQLNYERELNSKQLEEAQRMKENEDKTSFLEQKLINITLELSLKQNELDKYQSIFQSVKKQVSEIDQDNSHSL